MHIFDCWDVPNAYKEDIKVRQSVENIIITVQNWFITFCKISRFFTKNMFFFYNVHQYDGTRSDPGVLDAKSTLRSVTYRRSSEFPFRALFHLPQTRPSKLEILGDIFVFLGGPQNRRYVSCSNKSCHIIEGRWG